MPNDQFGIEQQEATFVARMRGPIASISGKFDLSQKRIIRDALLSGYRRDGALLNQWAQFGSDRERFIAYLLLRVNGSMPVYSTRPVPNETSELLSSREGNCGDLTFRLAMILDLFSIETSAIPWHTQAIEGHWFIDAYDPMEGKSYFLDPTNNLMAVTSSLQKDMGFLAFLASQNTSQRLTFLENNLMRFPIYFEDTEGLAISFESWSSSTYLRARDSTIAGLSYELPDMMEAWRTGKKDQPTTICEAVETIESALDKFRPKHCLSTAPLVDGSINITDNKEDSLGDSSR